jgi:hypothetical protein
MNSRRTFLSALLAIPAAAIAALKAKPTWVAVKPITSINTEAIPSDGGFFVTQDFASEILTLFDCDHKDCDKAIFFHDGEAIREYRNRKFYQETNYLPHNYDASRAYTERDEYYQYHCAVGTGFYRNGSPS